MSFKDLIKNILWIIFLLSIIFIIYQILLYIFGGSWEKADVIVGGIGLIITGNFAIAAFIFSQARTLGKLEERTKNFKNRFLNIETRLSKVEDTLNNIKDRLVNIERKI